MFGALGERGVPVAIKMDSVHHVYDTRFCFVIYIHDQQIPKQRDEFTSEHPIQYYLTLASDVRTEV